MHTHNLKQTHQNNFRSSFIKHILITAIGLIFFGIIYRFTSIGTIAIGGIVLAIIPAYFGVKGLIKLVQNIHDTNQPSPKKQIQPNESGHDHGYGTKYDRFVKIVTLGKEGAVREQCIELAQVHPGENILEVGCGTGSLTIKAATKTGPTGEVYGRDISSEMIEAARHKADQTDVNIDFQTGLIQNIEFPDNSFDLVLCSFVIHHVNENARSKGFSEIYRVLKPGGRLLIFEQEPTTNLLGRYLMRIFFGPKTLQRIIPQLLPMMEDTGFTILDRDRIDGSMFAYIRACKADQK